MTPTVEDVEVGLEDIMTEVLEVFNHITAWRPYRSSLAKTIALRNKQEAERLRRKGKKRRRYVKVQEGASESGYVRQSHLLC